MFKREVTYIHDGDTFVGQYRVADHGSVHSVSVQFEGASISARVGGLKEETVARTLLGELVREKFAEEATVLRTRERLGGGQKQRPAARTPLNEVAA